jgi:hypothetical protein
MRSPSLALLAAAAIIAAGCGGGDDASKAQDTVSTAVSGLAKGDAKTVCNQLTVPAQRRLLVLLAHNPLGFPDIQATNCLDAVTKLHGKLTQPQRNVLVDGEVEKAKVTGDKATVHVTGAGMTASLQKINGRWMITGGLFQ